MDEKVAGTHIFRLFDSMLFGIVEAVQDGADSGVAIERAARQFATSDVDRAIYAKGALVCYVGLPVYYAFWLRG